MAIYKFRITLDDEEEVTRLIEIRSTSTFQELHDIAIKAMAVTVPCTGTFFVSDNDWHKESTVGTFGLDAPEKNPRISSQVHDPHQRFLYELNATIQLYFMIELVKILGDNPGADLPAIIGGDGEIPKYYFQRPNPIADEDDLDGGDNALLKELEMMALMGLEDEDGEEPLEDDLEDVEAADDDLLEDKPKVKVGSGKAVEYAMDEDEEDEDEDDYKSDLDFGDGYDDIDMSGFSEDTDLS